MPVQILVFVWDWSGISTLGYANYIVPKREREKKKKKSVRDRAHLALKTESEIAEEAAQAARPGVDLTASACLYTNGMLQP